MDFAVEEESEKGSSTPVDSVKPTCVFILSEKSSGSSFLWRSITKHYGITDYPHTYHFENETLYWTKAASVLSLPQIKMEKSAVPYAKDLAQSQLKRFLSENLGKEFNSELDKETIFEEWFALCTKFGPVFIEKSPHHLLQLSALSLILEFKEKYKNQIDVKLLGLVRNPIDTIGSSIRRWGMSRLNAEKQWCKTYKNLIELRSYLGACDILLITFESFTKFPSQHLASIDDFIGKKANISPSFNTEKTKTTKSQKSQFIFPLQQTTIGLAQELGYRHDDLVYDWDLRSRGRYILWLYVRPLIKFLLRK